ncbi:MAG: HEPN domain-containing protein [Oscillospiraceae bacterium]|nr:HEPN domain-containing protein [Oscillospiraceae bacterium]
MNDKTQYWLDLADYDIETARAMLQTKRLLYVGFMCHQTAEKALKAIIANNDDAPPKIHGLMKLAQLGGVYDTMSEEQKDLLDTLDPLNIAARYPEQKAKLAAMLTLETCKNILTETEALLCWTKQLL